MNSFLRTRQACVSFFTRAFDFTGKTNRFDFWIVALIYSAINIAIDLENTPNTVQNVYLAVVLVPWLSLITRRLRDSGYKLIWLWRAIIPFYIGLIQNAGLPTSQAEYVEEKEGGQGATVVVEV